MFDVSSVLTQLTVDEKVRLLCGRDAWHLHGIDRLGIPSITLTDGPHGVRLSESQALDDSAQPATVFPVEAAMAASWNPDLLEQVAAAIGDECQSMGVGVLLGPGVNGKRTPLAGRNFEYFSEDPFLSGAMASAFVRGVQAQGVGACLKHFAGNEQETRRFLIDAHIDERTLQELYVEPFAKVIRENPPWTIMGAYNAVNGVHACQSPELLQHLLRDQLDYDGLIMSDWAAVKDKAESHINGLDVEMPGPGERDAEVHSALADGSLDMSDLDARVIRVLTLIEQVSEQKRTVSIDWPGHHELATQLAVESMVLLKNEAQQLPLTPNKSLAIIGDFARNPRFQGGGSSHMTPYQLTDALSAIGQRIDPIFAEGYTETRVSPEQLEAAVNAAADAERVVLLTGTTDSMESEGFDRTDMKLAPDHLMLISAVADANPNITLVLHSGSAVETRQFEHLVPAILQAWLPGEGGGEALARILFGDASPSGKLGETFPVRLEHNPTYETFPGTKDTVDYREGLFTGYRYYDTKALPVQYPFGHGLSYSQFELADLAYHSEHRQVSFSITNQGPVAGAEVVQLYIHDETSTYRRPVHELKAFQKVTLVPGEKRTVTLTLDDHAFAYFIPHLNRFAEEAGRFELRLGFSSRDIRLSGWVQIESDTEARLLPTLGDTVEDWLADERTETIIRGELDRLGFTGAHPMFGIAMGFPIPQFIQFIPHMGYSEKDAALVLQTLEQHWHNIGTAT